MTGAATEGPNKADITVVIPSYRGASTIVRAVESALSQNRGRVAVIVVIDDGCERTASLVRDLGDERVTVLANDRNLGAPASRNRGLELAGTPYVSFLDADDRFDGDFLAPLMDEMANGRADLGFGPSVRWCPAKGEVSRRVPDYRDHGHVFREWLGNRRNVNTASVLWSAPYLRSIGGWDTEVRRNQDGEIALRAILLGARFAQSSKGAGVWTDDRDRARVTTRTDNFGSLLYIVDKFMDMRSNVVSDQLRTRTCARYCLTIAHLAFSVGEDAIGNQALDRRRALGFADHDGDWRFVLSVSLRMVPRAPRMLLWKALRSTGAFTHPELRWE